MPLITSQEAEESGLIRAAELMLISARTAPKAKGEDDILTAMVFGEDKEKLASEMERMADERGDPGFRRDARSVRDSSIVVIIGVRGTKGLGLNCGGAAFQTAMPWKRQRRSREMTSQGQTAYSRSSISG